MGNKYVSGIFLAFTFLYSSFSFAQKINPDILQKRWPAFWLTVPNESPDGYGVYLFRKTVELNAKPAAFIIHVSADNRYKLFVNEKLVSLGPARGDLSHWNFETVDIANYLKAGKNIIAAQVWNVGEWKPEAQISFRTGFILQGATAKEAVVNTNDTWKCERDKSYAPLKFNARSYYVAGAGEIRNMAAHPKSWQSENFDDQQWQKAKQIFNGLPKTLLGPFGTTNGWMLVPSGIPQMELKDERLTKLISAEGGIKIPKGFPAQKNCYICSRQFICYYHFRPNAFNQCLSQPVFQ
jgi:alpha-L-rhamnosidase